MRTRPLRLPRKPTLRHATWRPRRESRLYPQVGAQALVSDNKESAHHLFSSSTGPKMEASNLIGAAASWEPDFWHAIRNSAHAQKRLAQASAADLATARLSLQAELANDYIAVRGFDAELEVLRQSIVAYQKAVEVARLRSEGKIASGLDLARALSQLDSAQAQETETELQRDLMQHAVAVLVGAMPSSFSIPPLKRVPFDPARASSGGAFGTVAASARHRERRTADGSRERLDRRIARRFLSQCHVERDGGIRGQRI